MVHVALRCFFRGFVSRNFNEVFVNYKQLYEPIPFLQPLNPCFFFPTLALFRFRFTGALLAPYCERFPQLLPVVEKLRPPEQAEAKKEEVLGGTGLRGYPHLGVS